MVRFGVRVRVPLRRGPGRASRARGLLDVGAVRGGSLKALRVCGRARRARPHMRKAFRVPPLGAPTSISLRARRARLGFRVGC